MKKYFKEMKNLLSLAVPVIFAQISQIAMGVIDTIMSGSISTMDVAAVALGTSIWLPTILFGHGLILILVPIISQLNGSSKRKYILNQVCQGFWLACFSAIIIMIILNNSKFLISHIHGLDPILVKKSISFLSFLSWGTPGYLFFQVLRCQCEGLSKTKPSMIISFIGLVSNIPINYVFMNGKFGLPHLGGIGCGIATASVYWIMFFSLLFYMYYKKNFDIFFLSKTFYKIKFIDLKKLFFLGLPIALSLFFEVTLFALVSLLIAPFGATAIAAHQIALNFSSLIFVLPLSIGSSATIRIGFRLGTGNIVKAKISSISSIILGIICSCITSICTAFFRKNIACLYNSSLEVVSMASHLMLLAAIYQISDSIQVIGNGILRGYKDTQSIFFITFFSYWIIGLPFGYILSLTNWIFPAMGPSGFWCGFVIGLNCSAILMIYRINWLQNQSSEYILKKILIKNN